MRVEGSRLYCRGTSNPRIINRSGSRALVATLLALRAASPIVSIPWSRNRSFVTTTMFIGTSLISVRMPVAEIELLAV